MKKPKPGSKNGLKIIWSPDALEDIESIGKYLARDSPFYAESTIQKIFETSQPLVYRSVNNIAYSRFICYPL